MIRMLPKSPLSLLPLLAVLQGTSAQNTGHWTMNASTPESNPSASGCVILAQLTDTTPPILQALAPICPSTSTVPTNPSDGMSVRWPLAANAGDGEGLKSQLLIYGQVAHKTERTDIHMAQAGCVMRLSADQAQYMLGRSLTWNNGLQELWDNTGNGFVLNPEGNARAACGKNNTLLPESLWFPDPYIVDAANPIWQTPITVTVQAAPAPVPIVNGTAAFQNNTDVTTSQNGTQYSAVLPAPEIVAGVQNGTDKGVLPAPVVANVTVVANATNNATTAQVTTTTVAAVVDPSSSASLPPSSSAVSSGAVIGANLVGMPSGSVAVPKNDTPVVTASPSVVAGIQAECTASVSTTTVTQIWTSTITQTVTASAPVRRGLRMWF